MKHITIHVLAHCLTLVGSQLASGDNAHIVCRHGYQKTADGYKSYTDEGTAIAVGTTSDGRTIFYTAAHNVDSNRNGVYIADGKRWCKCTVHESVNNNAVDYAIVTARLTVPIKCSLLSQDTPREGQEVMGSGYVKGESGCRRYHAKVDAFTGSEKRGFWSSGEAAKSGQSGGPCYGRDMRVVGIISAENGERTVYTTARYVTQRCVNLFGFAPS